MKPETAKSADTLPTGKICTGCKILKPLRDFYDTCAQCMPCIKVKRAEYYKNNRETHIARVKEYDARHPHRKQA